MFCKYEYCYLPHLTKGYCDAHYRQYQRNEEDETKLKPLRYSSYRYTKCTTKGCYEARHSNGLCSRHLSLLRKDNSIIHVIKEEGECSNKCYASWCNNSIHNLYLCETHFNQLKRCKGEEVVNFLLEKHISTLKCKVPYCTSIQITRGYCSHHYHRSKKCEIPLTENPTVLEGELAKFRFKECEYLNCGRETYEGGLCRTHKNQLDRSKGDYSKLTSIKSKHSDSACDEINCTNIFYRNGKCEKHYRFERFELNLKNQHDNRLPLIEKERRVVPSSLLPEERMENHV